MSLADYVAVVQAGAGAVPAESTLRSDLAIQLLTEEQLVDNPYRFLLRYISSVLTLTCTDPGSPGGLFVDFDAPELTRRRGESLKSQNLGKALGLKKYPTPKILDATAGLGTDSFLCAAAGCQVHLVERNPVVRALLEDGLRRALCSHSELEQIVKSMKIIGQDFLQFSAAPDVYDVVYLDPMFPQKKKSAKSGKAMYILQQLITESSDESEMLVKALGIASKRVVIKRARRSPVVNVREPDIVYSGSSNRFDVYLKL